MANVVKNAKKAAADTLTAVVNVVKGKGGKPVKTADGRTPGDFKPAKKDTPDTSVVSPKPKKKGKAKPADLSVPRNAVSKAILKGLHKSVDGASCTTAVNTLGRGSNRAKVFGLSASSVWRALGFRKVGKEFVYTVSDAKGFRDGLGLGDVITDTNVKCQFGDGRGRANGNDPLYGGDVAELDDKQWAVVDRMVKAAREA